MVRDTASSSTAPRKRKAKTRNATKNMTKLNEDTFSASMNRKGSRQATTTSPSAKSAASSVCSPAVAHAPDPNYKGLLRGTCLDAAVIAEVSRWADAHLPSNTAGGTEEPRGKHGATTQQDHPEAVLDALHAKFGTHRGAEYLWLKPTGPVPKSSSAGRSLSRAFRPAMPDDWITNSRAWLSNFDIEDVMRQYEDLVPDFWFVGVFPMDFALVLRDGLCVSVEMCGLSIAKMRAEGKTRAGIILNTDKHDESGSHWVALYVDICPSSPVYGIYYYDSVANATPREVESFAAALRREVSDDKFVFATNRVRRQYQNTECGVFTMFFVVCCLSREMEFDYICRHMGNDDHLHTLRAVFFRPPQKAAAAALSARRKDRGEFRELGGGALAPPRRLGNRSRSSSRNPNAHKSKTNERRP